MRETSDETATLPEDVQRSIDLWKKYSGTARKDRSLDEVKQSAAFWREVFPRKIVVTIVSQTGHCANHHTVGQQFELTTNKEGVVGYHKGGLCPAAYNAVFPYFVDLLMGGHPWYGDPDAIFVPCSDPKNPVVMEVRRVIKK